MVGCLQGKTCKGSFTRINDRLTGQKLLEVKGKLEATAGIEPAFTALQAAA